MRIEYHTMPDDLGRCKFTVYWWSNGKAGECEVDFHDDPRKYGFLPPKPEDVKEVQNET